MSDWLTAGDIAGAELPGLPRSERAVQRLAIREGWDDHPSYVRSRQGRGGGREYHAKLLPLEAQIALRQDRVNLHIPANDEPPEAPVPPEAPLSASAALERDARLAIVRAYDRFANGLDGLKQSSKVQMFTDRYRMGGIKVDDWVRDAVPGFSKRSLLRWRSIAKRGQNGLAVDRGQSRRGTGTLDTAEGGRVKDFVLGLLAAQPFLSGAHVRTLCRDEFGDRLTVERRGAPVSKPMPPERTFQAFIKRIKTDHKVELTRLQNPDLYRSTMRASGTNSLSHVTRANQLWQIDASPVDALCVDGRHNVYACIDIATRRVIFLISKTPRASAVGLLMRKAILAWGVPEVVKTDNGSDFVARDSKRLLAALDIEMEVSDAYSPQQKGHVERVIKTFQHDFAPLLTGFVGHSVADRTQIEGAKSFAQRLGTGDDERFGVDLTSERLQELADDWAATKYAHAKHGGLKGETPFAAANRLSAGRRDVSERALDLLLMPVAGGGGLRTVTKFGLRIDGNHYRAPGLLPGQQVLVRQDMHDKGRVLVFAPDGERYLGEAICAVLCGVDPRALIKAHREQEAEWVNEATSKIRRDMRQIKRGGALIERALRVASRDAPNIVPLRRPGTEHSTPQIAAAASATERGFDPGDISAEAQVAQQKMIADLDLDAAAHEAGVQAERRVVADNVTALPETAKDRYRRAMVVIADMAAESADPRDVLWLGGYRTTPEFKAQQEMHREFGDRYLGL